MLSAIKQYFHNKKLLRLEKIKQKKMKKDLLEANYDILDNLTESEAQELFNKLISFTTIIYATDKKDNPYLNEYFNNFFSTYDSISIIKDLNTCSISYKEIIYYLGDTSGPFKSDPNKIVVIGNESEGGEEFLKAVYIKERSIKNGIFIQNMNDGALEHEESQYPTPYYYLLDRIFTIHNISLRDYLNK